MEDWKDIPGYEGIYQASNEGRIRSAPGKTTESVRHGTRHWKVRIIKTKKQSPPKRQDERVCLWKDKEPSWFLVARLIAMTWCDGYQEGFTVNHIDGNCLNNHANNLEWVSRAENIRLGFEDGLYSSACKRCIITSLNGESMEFRSLSMASKYLGRNHGYIETAIKNHRKVVSKSGEEFRVEVID